MEDSFAYKINFNEIMKMLDTADGLTLGEKLQSVLDIDTSLVLLSLVEQCYQQYPETALEYTFTILNKTAVEMEINNLVSRKVNYE